MNNELGKVTYPAFFSQDNELYSVYFPDFDIKGTGFPDLDDTVEFASSMLGEIVIDYRSKGLELPKRSTIIKDNRENAIYKDITIDADIYDFKAKRNSERLFFVKEELLAADSPEKKTSTKIATKLPSWNRYIAITLIAILCITGILVLSEISHKREQAKKEAEVALFDECLQNARDDIKQELYNKAREDIVKVYDLDTLEPGFRRAERESLYYYAQLLSLRSNGSIIDDQYELLDNIEFSKDDEFYEDYQSIKSEILEEYNSAEVKGKLQHYFLAIDDNMSIDELKDASEMRGFYTETLEVMDGLHYLYISEEPKTGYGSGAEINYTYDVDHITVTFYSDDSPNHKDYFFREKYATVYCNIENGEAVFENWNNEYREKFVEPRISKEFDNVKDAMKYANDYEYIESE